MTQLDCRSHHILDEIATSYAQLHGILKKGPYAEANRESAVHTHLRRCEAFKTAEDFYSANKEGCEWIMKHPWQPRGRHTRFASHDPYRNKSKDWAKNFPTFADDLSKQGDFDVVSYESHGFMIHVKLLGRGAHGRNVTSIFYISDKNSPQLAAQQKFREDGVAVLLDHRLRTFVAIASGNGPESHKTMITLFPDNKRLTRTVVGARWLLIPEDADKLSPEKTFILGYKYGDPNKAIYHMPPKRGLFGKFLRK